MTETPEQPDIVEIDGKRYSRAMLGQMADDIEIAHAANPRSWALVESSNQMVLNVASNNVIYGFPSYQNKLAIDTSSDLGENGELAYELKSPIQPGSLPSVEFLRLKQNGADWQVVTFRSVHERAVKRLAETGNLANQWQTYRDDLRGELEALTGKDLPVPGYWVPRESKLSAVPLAQLVSHLAANGLHYTDAQVATFVTALQTKGFVVLSGISGTGKSKIATGTVEMLPNLRIAEVSLLDTSGMIPLTIKPYMRTYKRVVLPARHVELLPPLPVGEQTEVTVTLDDLSGSGRLEHRAHTGGTSIVVLYFRGEIGKAIANLDLGTSLYLNPVLDEDAERVIAFESVSSDRLSMPSHLDGNAMTIRVIPDMKKSLRVDFRPLLEHFPRPHEHRIKSIDVEVGDSRGTARLTYDGDRNKKTITLNMHAPLRPAVEALRLGERIAVQLRFDERGDEIVGIRFSELATIAHSEPGSMSNHLFLSVRPDWRDSTSLLGYYNPLTETYEWTEFLRFVIRAGDNYDGPAEDRIAWFVILDEMNLAHVEYYFADFLSVLESGRDDAGWTREPLRLTYPDTLDDEVPPRELKLPPNLYIIGTVNMDETTHAFSPKVLDRAFTIELTDVDFEHYAITGQAGEATLSDDEKRALLAAFSRGGKFARIDKTEAAVAVANHPEIRTYLQSLNELLQQNRMHFGYRVFDEIAMYLAVNDENGMMDFLPAFDQAVFMKVLPKFTGSLARLRSPLHKVLAWAIDPLRTSTADVNEAGNQVSLYIQGKAESAWTTEPRFPVVATRVRDMLVTLETDGFVSFG